MSWSSPVVVLWKSRCEPMSESTALVVPEIFRFTVRVGYVYGFPNLLPPASNTSSKKVAIGKLSGRADRTDAGGRRTLVLLLPASSREPETGQVAFGGLCPLEAGFNLRPVRALLPSLHLSICLPLYINSSLTQRLSLYVLIYPLFNNQLTLSVDRRLPIQVCNE